MLPDPNSKTSKSAVASAYLGGEYSAIFTSDTISFINDQNNKANGNNGAVDYGQKMRDICGKIIKAGGTEFFDILQITRFKERSLTQNRQGNFYKLLSDFDLTAKTAERFAFELAESHQPSSQFRRDWEGRAKASLKNFIENQEYQKVKEKCKGKTQKCDQNYILPVKTALFYCGFGVGAICKPNPTTQFLYSDSYGNKIMHDGVDFSSNQGTPVYAIADGEFTSFFCKDPNALKTCNGGFGNYIAIKHNNTIGVDFKSSYGHLSKIENIKDGSIVKKGDKIGEIGTTGNSTGNHLHLQIRRLSNNKLVDPCSDEFGLKCPELGTYIKEN
jgi:murein DD-endopeptidase MepM/ murein hydrolase activator NlpD